MKYITLASVGNYLTYAVLGIILLAVFTRLYIWFTPYNELDEMRKNKKAPAFALGGGHARVYLSDHVNVPLWGQPR